MSAATCDQVLRIDDLLCMTVARVLERCGYAGTRAAFSVCARWRRLTYYSERWWRCVALPMCAPQFPACTARIHRPIVEDSWQYKMWGCESSPPPPAPAELCMLRWFDATAIPLAAMDAVIAPCGGAQAVERVYDLLDYAENYDYCDGAVSRQYIWFTYVLSLRVHAARIARTTQQPPDSKRRDDYNQMMLSGGLLNKTGMLPGFALIVSDYVLCSLGPDTLGNATEYIGMCLKRRHYDRLKPLLAHVREHGIAHCSPPEFCSLISLHVGTDDYSAEVEQLVELFVCAHKVRYDDCASGCLGVPRAYYLPAFGGRPNNRATLLNVFLRHDTASMLRAVIVDYTVMTRSHTRKMTPALCGALLELRDAAYRRLNVIERQSELVVVSAKRQRTVDPHSSSSDDDQ